MSNLDPDIQVISQQLTAQVARINSELEVALLVSQYLTPANPIQDVVFKALERLKAEQCLGDVDKSVEKLQGLNFTGPKNGVAALRHSNLFNVVEDQEGIPISLAVFYQAFFRRAKLQCSGINFPGHFLLQLEDQLFDPLSCEVIDPSILPQILPGEVSVDAALQQVATPQLIGMRMFNNIKALHLSQQNWLKALEVVDLQEACCLDNQDFLATLCFERGDLWQKVGANQQAAQAYEQCANYCENPTLIGLKEQAQQLSEDMRKTSETLH